MLNGFFEAFMMATFSVSWVFSIIRSVRSRSTGGKSIAFLWLIFSGYAAGIIHKVFFLPDWVIWIYLMNTSMVTADILLFYRNRRIESKRA